MRVQVSTDTCEGLAVAVSHASGFSGTTAKISGRPREAFWVVDTVRDVDASGKVLTDRTTAVVLLPAGQRVCGIAAGSAAKPSPGSTPTLTDPVTTPTGHGWQATFAGMPSLANPQGATLRICAGSHVVEPALRPLNAITDPGPTPTGSAGTRADGVALQSVTCPSGTVNSGTVDRSAGASGVPGIRDLARGWAREAGLLDRFPDVVLTVAGDDRSTTATFVDHTGVRAELVFVRTADAWTLHELAYC
ncbi:MAG: hypothetical protein IE926_12145 [Micrococcales bacterium]|nr:hypothetical protein [Micrococcales bacterium]